MQHVARVPPHTKLPLASSRRVRPRPAPCSCDSRRVLHQLDRGFCQRRLDLNVGVKQMQLRCASESFVCFPRLDLSPRPSRLVGLVSCGAHAAVVMGLLQSTEILLEPIHVAKPSTRRGLRQRHFALSMQHAACVATQPLASSRRVRPRAVPWHTARPHAPSTRP